MAYDVKNLERFPARPGVYLMKDKEGNILYVGKAKNLRQRVKQYFAPGGDGRAMAPFLVSKIDEIEILIVSSEKEALLTENNLIKRHQPPYNALLKDDKAYIALKVLHKSPWPLIQIARYKGKPDAGALYFGPYANGQAARRTFDLLHRLFPLRQCSDQEFARRIRPCILYDMKRCLAPCVGKCTREEYGEQVKRAVKFLKGQDREVIRDLQEEMEKRAEALEFEKAAEILKAIRAIESVIEEQHVDKPLGGDLDAIQLYRQGDEAIICRLLFRGGKLWGSKIYNFSRVIQDDEELLESFLLQYYEKEKSDAPAEILIPIELEAKETIADILSEAMEKKTILIYPQKGEKRALVEMAYLNAEGAFNREKDLQALKERTLLDMQEKLRLKRYPRRIECLDNSHLAGTNAVAALIAFTEGKKDSKYYRKYRLSRAGGDDYESMREVLERRYKRAAEEQNLPDLLIIDGGKGHLNAASQALSDLGIVSLDLIGLAKEEGRHDKGMTEEKVFLPDLKEPFLLPKNSPVLFLLQRIRDEAHRFALEFQRKLRSKKTIKSVLEEIPGIGPMKRKALLKAFGSVKSLRQASAEELRKTAGISEANIASILHFFEQNP